MIEVLTKTFHPQGHHFFQVVRKKNSDKENILYSMETEETIVTASVFYFQYCWQTCKNNLHWYCKRSTANEEAANMQEMYVAVVQFYRRCLSRWANHKFKKTRDIATENVFFCFLVLMKMKLIYYIFVSFI